MGCEAFASDLNPVACLILKVMLEDIPRHGPGLADELRKAGAEIKAKARGRNSLICIPKDPDGATPGSISLGPDRAVRGTQLRGRDSL